MIGRSGSEIARRFGLVMLALALTGAVVAPFLSPHASDARFDMLLNAPPTPVHLADADGRFRGPFIYPLRRINQLEQRYDVDLDRPTSLIWLANGHLVQSADEEHAPLMLLGTDSFGRDVFARLLHGARVSLSLSIVAAILAIVIGALVGGAAGYLGGVADDAVMRVADFVLVLPSMYVALALRSVLPLVLTPAQVFWLLLIIFAVLGAPSIARGVRAIVRTERHHEYALAAASLGAGHVRLLVRHLLPAAGGFLVVQLTMLVPAFILAEATLSYVGLGFPDAVASWGTMLRDASNLRALADFPWLLSPAAAMFLVVLAVNLVLQRGPSLVSKPD